MDGSGAAKTLRHAFQLACQVLQLDRCGGTVSSTGGHFPGTLGHAFDPLGYLPSCRGLPPLSTSVISLTATITSAVPSRICATEPSVWRASPTMASAR